MKVSDIRIDTIKDFCGISDDDSDNILAVVMPAAKAFIAEYTGLTPEQIDQKEEFGFAYMALVNDMYTNRDYSSSQSKVLNPCVKVILDASSVNYVGWVNNAGV